MTRAAIFLAGCALCVMACGCESSWDAEYARGRQDGYRAALDSIDALPQTMAIGLMRMLDANGLRYTILAQRGDSTVAQIHGGAPLRADTIRHNVVRYAR